MRRYIVLVIFEGLDNCGKTTLVEMIKDYYSKLGIATEISKEFETNIGKELKKMAKEGTLDPILKAYLFATDRYIRIKNIRQEDLKNKIMLFDRYVRSCSPGVKKVWKTGVAIPLFPKTFPTFFSLYFFIPPIFCLNVFQPKIDIYR